jgi:hypothetical protein
MLYSSWSIKNTDAYCTSVCVCYWFDSVVLNSNPFSICSDCLCTMKRMFSFPSNAITRAPVCVCECVSYDPASLFLFCRICVPSKFSSTGTFLWVLAKRNLFSCQTSSSTRGGCAQKNGKQSTFTVIFLVLQHYIPDWVKTWPFHSTQLSVT